MLCPAGCNVKNISPRNKVLYITSELFTTLMQRGLIVVYRPSLQMGPIGCPEMSLNNCQPTLRNIPEERRPQLPWTIIIEPTPTSQCTRCPSQFHVEWPEMEPVSLRRVSDDQSLKPRHGPGKTVFFLPYSFLLFNQINTEIAFTFSHKLCCYPSPPKKYELFNEKYCLKGRKIF